MIGRETRVTRAARGDGTPLWKKLLLSVAATVVFFLVLEGVLALAGVRPALYADDPYVGFSSLSPLFVEQELADGSSEMVTATDKYRLFNPQRFEKDKPRGVTRVFCVGGSTTFGRPYDDVTSFCGWLRVLLPAADPSRSWQVINAGGVSYASYRVAVLMEELSEYEPDLFVIYSGHNEFLESRTYAQIIAMPEALRGLGALASRTRGYAAMQRVVAAFGGGPQRAADSQPDLLAEEVTTMLDDAVGPSAYQRDDEQRERVLGHYRYNLARMVDIARSVGSEALLITPASNLGSCTPFKSEHRTGLTDEGKTRWQEHVMAAQAAVREGDGGAAIAELVAAQAIDDRHAHLHFMAGQVYAGLGMMVEAKRELERARDEDVCPLRALGPMRELVSEVAADRGVALVDFVAAAEAASQHGIPGGEIFLDHVHPTIRGNRLIALEVIQTLAEQGFLRLDSTWSESVVAQLTAEVEATLDTAAHALALMKLSKVLGWAGKISEAYELAQRAEQMHPDDARIQYQAGLTADLLGRVDESIEHYRRAVEIDPSAGLAWGNLGVAMEKKGDVEGAIECHRRAVATGAQGSLPRNRANLANALGRQGVLLMQRGDVKAAVTVLTEADALQPGDIRVLAALAAAQVELGDFDRGLATLDRALAGAPDNAEVHNRKAIALMLAGREQEAMASYQRAIQLDPGLAERPHALPKYIKRTGRVVKNTGRP